MFESLISVSNKYELIVGFAVIGLMMWFSFWVSEKWTKGRIHGSAIAIMLGLTLAYVSGAISGGTKGAVDIPLLSGIGLLGGAMLRDFAIIATGFGVKLDELKKSGMVWCNGAHSRRGDVLCVWCRHRDGVRIYRCSKHHDDWCWSRDLHSGSGNRCCSGRKSEVMRSLLPRAW